MIVIIEMKFGDCLNRHGHDGFSSTSFGLDCVLSVTTFLGLIDICFSKQMKRDTESTFTV